RYGNPSIASVVAQMAADGITEVLLFPQYPHYAMSSWAPLVVAGAWFGRRLVLAIDQRLFENIALGLSLVAGLRLLW
ncbi:MAG: ferrochelatase, partial [Opitutaceae bacterium]